MLREMRTRTHNAQRSIGPSERWQTAQDDDAQTGHGIVSDEKVGGMRLNHH